MAILKYLELNGTIAGLKALTAWMITVQWRLHKISAGDMDRTAAEKMLPLHALQVHQLNDRPSEYKAY